MGVTISDGKVTVSASYGVTVNKGDFNSEKLSQGIVLEYDVTGDSAAVLAAAQAQQDELVKAVKIAVMANLGVEAETTADGSIAPKFATAPATVAPAAAPKDGPFGGAGGGQFKPKADLTDNPRFAADLDGKGQTMWIDLRPTKAAGLFSPKAADFRDVNDSKHQVWLTDKSGAVKQSVAEALQAAGVAV